MNVQSIVSLDLRDDWRAFAKKMFALEDADPGYLLLARSELTHGQKLRYILAWCTFYNPGIAALACDYEGAKFYEFLRSQYPTAKRASERRHFRGQAGLKAMAQWQALYPKPEAMVEACYGQTYLEVRRNMKHMAQMGDYFYWKLADIFDTVFGWPVDFTGCEKYMPKVPKQGAELIAELNSTCFELSVVMGDITRHVNKIDHAIHPRRLMLQEAETVCCVFKQHVHGDYKFGQRTYKAWNRLMGSGGTKTAYDLLDGIYAGGIWTPELLIEVGDAL